MHNFRGSVPTFAAPAFFRAPQRHPAPTPIAFRRVSEYVIGTEKFSKSGHRAKTTICAVTRARLRRRNETEGNFPLTPGRKQIRRQVIGEDHQKPSKQTFALYVTENFVTRTHVPVAQKGEKVAPISNLEPNIFGEMRNAEHFPRYTRSMVQNRLLWVKIFGL